ncbi:MAG: transporter substrate-binding domain-containing protein [Pseudoflavonifractor sp.]
MKMMKSVCCLGLALTMSVTLLAGCGSKPAPSAAAWTSAADLEGKKIAVQEGTTGNSVASEVKDAEVSTFKAATACAMELMNGRVDCVIIDSNPALKLVEANADKLKVLDFPASEDKETYAIATQKNDGGAALAEEFNAAMKTLKEDGTFDAIMQKYIAGEDVTLPALPTYTAKGTLVMGTNCEFEPFEFLTSDGTPTGFDVDYVKYLCAVMGYDVTVENLDFDALIPALQSGRVDFIAAGLTKNPEREENANFTEGYYEAVQSIIVKK